MTQRAVRRLPRLALWLLCAAYVLPGIFFRDPWKNADITAFGYMLSLVRGDSGWLNPSIAGLSSEGSALPYWLGAWSIQAFGGWMDQALAARLPFALLLVATLALTWYACFHLARTDEAQPLPFAFGGEASRIDYACTMADASVLALIAPLGLLQLGHETTPELVQLAASSLLLYGLAASRHRHGRSIIALLVALPALALSGAATTGLLYGGVGVVLARRSSHAPTRALVPWLLLGMLISAAAAAAVDAWASRLAPLPEVLGMPKLLAWFTWPIWPLVGWTLWRWRRQLGHHHVLIPLSVAAVAIGASAAMGASERALMIALPSLAVLAAFSLPTLKRTVSAAIDWFSVFFFSILALLLWVLYASVQTGVPAQPAINIARLAPGFEHRFNAPVFVLALLATIAWIWLVRWRTSQHRPVLWKSLVLPASGVALSWLLLMTLWLPLLDHARSYRPLMNRIARIIPAEACIAGPDLGRSQLAALEAQGRWRLSRDRSQAGCDWMIIRRTEAVNRPAPSTHQVVPQGWRLVDKLRRPTDRNEVFYLYRRA
ncbi:hypothetical protein [Sphaerotilus hippei]|uniref:hypothetical protein n=1 Tax=Sphaerotilus hippei TaxID=744406 RepID=UPI001FE74403|nr:hypothetical protein [Sphaerotilus hippei]